MDGEVVALTVADVDRRRGDGRARLRRHALFVDIDGVLTGGDGVTDGVVALQLAGAAQRLDLGPAHGAVDVEVEGLHREAVDQPDGGRGQGTDIEQTLDEALRVLRGLDRRRVPTDVDDEVLAGLQRDLGVDDVAGPAGSGQPVDQVFSCDDVGDDALLPVREGERVGRPFGDLALGSDLEGDVDGADLGEMAHRDATLGRTGLGRVDVEHARRDGARLGGMHGERHEATLGHLDGAGGERRSGRR